MAEHYPYPAWVDEELPPCGPCIFCGAPDKRHRMIDTIVSCVASGEGEDFVARNYEVSEAFVLRLFKAFGPCSCGNRQRPHINHRKTIPCWTYIGDQRHNIDKRGRVVRRTA